MDQMISLFRWRRRKERQQQVGRDADREEEIGIAETAVPCLREGRRRRPKTRQQQVLRLPTASLRALGVTPPPTPAEASRASG